MATHPRIALTSIVSGVAVSAAAWLLLAEAAPTTGARRVTWFGPDGQTIERLPPGEIYPWNCGGLDIHLSSLQFDDALYTICRHEDLFPQGALGRIRSASLDGGQGIGEVRWPVPETLPISYMVGLAPGREGRLGIVYVAGEVGGRLAVGVAGREQWACAPRVLPGGPGSRLFGVAWADDTLEVVFFPASTNDAYGHQADAHILRLGPDCGEEIRTVARDLLSAGLSYSNVALAWRRPTEAGWVFAVSRGDRGELALWEITEAGARTPSVWAPQYATGSAVFSASREIVRTSAGLLATSPYFTATLQPDGSLAARPAPIAEGWELTGAWHHFAAQDTSLAWLPLWSREGTPFGVARLIGGRAVVTWSGEGVEGYPLTLSLLGEDTPPIVVARASSFSCGKLVVGTLLPRTPGGHWLVEPSGCYIGLDTDWQRTDPLDLAEHLRRRGSIGMDWNEPQHAWLLGWALFGLPVSAGVGAIIGALAGRVRAVSVLWVKGVVAGAWLYIVTAAWALMRLLPLLLS